MSHKVPHEINVLNNLLQGVYIGIDGYTKCLNKIKDPDIRHVIEHQELEQREMAMELASHIRDLGGTPKENAGAKGTMASFMSTMKLADNEDTVDILDMLSQGVKMGITSNEEAASKLSGKSKEIVEKHLTEDKKALEALYNLKNKAIN